MLKSDIKWECFRDGWPNIFIENVEEIAGRDGERSVVVRSVHVDTAGM